MSLKVFFKKNQDTILDKWFDMVVKTYGGDTARFLTNEKDPFSNPVGHSIRQSLESLLNLLSEKDLDEKKIKAAVDPMIRIRAVQDFSASKSVGVVFFLKSVVRDLLAKNAKKNDIDATALEELDRMLDIVCLSSFDVFMGCREQIYSFKASHVRDRTKKLLEKAGLLAEVSEAGVEIMSQEVYKKNFDHN